MLVRAFWIGLLVQAFVRHLTVTVNPKKETRFSAVCSSAFFVCSSDFGNSQFTAQIYLCYFVLLHPSQILLVTIILLFGLSIRPRGVQH